MKTCNVLNCNKKHYGKGYCIQHYYQFSRTGKVHDIKPKYTLCTIPNCNEKHCAKGLCNKHLQQIYHYGFIKERTVLTPNIFIKNENVCIILLFNRKGKHIETAQIDINDMKECQKYKWHVKYLKNLPYVYSKLGSLASLIHKKKPIHPFIIDHIDGNTLNNKRTNLQIISQRQNTIKKKTMTNNTSGYRGVVWNKRDKKWQSQIGCNYKLYHLGNFLSPELAALAYNQKAKELFGEFAVLNKVPQRTRTNGRV